MDEFGKLVHTIKSLPVTVSNRLNARQSEVFTEFGLKSSIKPIESIWCFFRNVNDPKKYFVDEFTELVYTVKLRYRHNHL